VEFSKYARRKLAQHGNGSKLLKKYYVIAQEITLNIILKYHELDEY